MFEFFLALLAGAVVLATVADRLRAPYPALLALGGVALAFVPGAPAFELDPELALALFIAPVLVDAAYRSSLRDLRAHWRPVATLVFVAVALTIAAVAWVVHLLVPEMPLAAAIALGAIVAPPDAAAATAVLRAVKPPHRVMVILEGESLFNDATALIAYRFAVAAAMTGAFSLTEAIPTFVGVMIGSLVLAYALARAFLWIDRHIPDTASTVVVQFIGAFGVWLAAEALHLSGIVTVVVYAIVLARHAPEQMDARHRLSATAVWDTAVFVLNAVAFTLIGLQVRPILAEFGPNALREALIVSAAVLGVVIVVRMAWVLLYNRVAVLTAGRRDGDGARDLGRPTLGSGLAIGWCGMRGIVTIAAALALPRDFPERDLILFVAAAVALSTLVLQGLTLRPFIAALDLPHDDLIERETGEARAEALKASIETLEGEGSRSAAGLKREYVEALAATEEADGDRGDTEANALRRRAVEAARARIIAMRNADEIGDDAFRTLEAEFDLIELGAREPATEASDPS